MSERATYYKDILGLLGTLCVGDTVEVESPSGKARRLTVTGHFQKGVTLSSGKVRSGHRAGGALIDYGEKMGVMFQPTLLQNIREVRALTLIDKVPR